MLSGNIITRIWILCLGLLLIGCGPTQENIDGKTMGTYYSIKYIESSGAPDKKTLKMEIDQRLERVNDQMSTYRPQSELSRFNQSRAVNVPFAVSTDLLTVVREAIRINHMTEGGLDITVGPLVNLWGFGPEGRREKQPDASELEKRRAWVGIEKLQVEPGALVKTIPELYVDLSSIAKGYAVDVIAEYLSSLSIDNYMVDIGGEVRTRGHNGKQKPWRIAIEKPESGLAQQAQEVIEPGEMGMATSGSYRNYFEENGQRFSHTIDPATGYPIQHRLVSITVLSPSCMTADGLATGLGVLGPEKGMAIAERFNIPILMLVKTDSGYEERYSAAFKPFLSQQKR